MSEGPSPAARTARLAELQRRLAAAARGGGTERIARQHAAGKLTARERVELLPDPASFVEIDARVTHEEVTMEELGGALTHAAKSGVCHFTVPNDAACLAGLRDLLSYLPSNNLDDPPPGRSEDDPDRESSALNGLVPEDPNRPYDIKRLIAEVVDDGAFLEVHSHYSRNLVVRFARFANRSVGIVANQPAYLAGGLDIDASAKGARFVRFCHPFTIPLATF